MCIFNYGSFEFFFSCFPTSFFNNNSLFWSAFFVCFSFLLQTLQTEYVQVSNTLGFFFYPMTLYIMI